MVGLALVEIFLSREENFTIFITIIRTWIDYDIETRVMDSRLYFAPAGWPSNREQESGGGGGGSD